MVAMVDLSSLAYAIAESQQWDLPPSGESPGKGRCLVRGCLVAWKLPALVDDVTLITSELVTNAIRYAFGPVCLTLQRVDSLNGKNGVCVQVRDIGDGIDAVLGGRSLASVDCMATSGRGLIIVQAMATASGYVKSDEGHTVWAYLQCRDLP
ncbi:ATP-binding protein [Streptomyces sp. NPDC055709]